VPVVTALRATRGGRIAVHVDGEYLCAVGEAFVARWRLYKGRELDEASLAQISNQASRERALADAYRLLGHRSRSRAELRRRLLQKDHGEEVVDGVLERLTEDGLLDDAEFARRYVADKRTLSRWGEQRIRRGLAELGVAPAVIDAAVGSADAAAGEDAEYARALAVLRAKGPPRPPLEAARRRAYQTLLRRGFAGGLAYRAVRRWSGEDGLTDDG
jgi:regulatory protein